MFVIRKGKLFYGKENTVSERVDGVMPYHERRAVNALFKKIGGQLIDLEKKRIIKESEKK